MQDLTFRLLYGTNSFFGDEPILADNDIDDTEPDSEPVDLAARHPSIGQQLEDAWRMEHDDEPYPT